MVFPENLKYTNDHEWIRLEGKEAYVGITDYAQNELGEIVFIDVPTIGETLNKASVFGSIEAVKTVSDLLMPIDGKVLEVNSDLDDQPELVNSNPYEEGWIIKIEITQEDAVSELMDAGAYRTFTGK